MDLYSSDDYKEILKARMEFLRERDPSFTFQEMAKSCRVQKPYLSRVLNRDGHLNADQLFLAADYLGLNAEEKTYLFLVFDHQRSDLGQRREQIEAKLRKFRARAKTTAKYLPIP